MLQLSSWPTSPQRKRWSDFCSLYIFLKTHLVGAWLDSVWSCEVCLWKLVHRTWRCPCDLAHMPNTKWPSAFALLFQKFSRLGRWRAMAIGYSSSRMLPWGRRELCWRSLSLFASLSRASKVSCLPLTTSSCLKELNTYIYIYLLVPHGLLYPKRGQILNWSQLKIRLTGTCRRIAAHLWTKPWVRRRRVERSSPQRHWRTRRKRQRRSLNHTSLASQPFCIA